MKCGGREDKRRQGATWRQIEYHPWKTVFKKWIQFCLMHPPFWFSMLKSKQGYTHTTGKELIIITLGSHALSSEGLTWKQNSILSADSQHQED